MKLDLKNLRREVKAGYEQPEMSGEQIERLKLTMEQAKQENRRERRSVAGIRVTVVAAIVFLVLVVLPNTSKTVALAMHQIPVLGSFIKLVTVRDYEYEDEYHDADIKVGELVLEDISGVDGLDASVKKELAKTIAEINEEIQEISGELLDAFEDTVQEGYGPQATMVKSELLPSTEHYLVVKLNCFTAAGSGIEWNYYYTVDLTTGKQIVLAELFQEGVDYITPISENILKQMREQMAEDPGKSFDIDDDLFPVDVAEVIRDKQAFYVNEHGNVVICFDEGDVAAMYMGALEFEIDNEVLKELRR